MLSIQEQAQLDLFKEMGTLSQSQALEYHTLLCKEEEPVIEAALVEEKPKKKRK